LQQDHFFFFFLHCFSEVAAPRTPRCITVFQKGKSNLALETYFNTKGRQVQKRVYKTEVEALNAMISYQVFSTGLNRMTT